jgi:FAD/FMN-containing dehydrogenase
VKFANETNTPIIARGAGSNLHTRWRAIGSAPNAARPTT